MSGPIQPPGVPEDELEAVEGRRLLLNYNKLLPLEWSGLQ